MQNRQVTGCDKYMQVPGQFGKVLLEAGKKKDVAHSGIYMEWQFLSTLLKFYSDFAESQCSKH